jgi:glycosyltransferase involved in cell wall biosynthesis
MKKLVVLAIVPSGFCFGLQNLTLAFFGKLKDRIRPYFLTTRWSDGEFSQRLTALGISHSATWLGMFSRRFDRRNLKMTAECALKLPVAWWDVLKLCHSLRPDVIYLANHHEVILLWPLLVWLRSRVVCHMHDPPPPSPFQKISFFFWRRAVGRFFFISKNVRARTALLGRLGPHDVIVYNGVSIAVPSSGGNRDAAFCVQFGWPKTAVIFGMTGQVSRHKGHEDFIASAAEASRGNPLFRFVVGGRGSDEFLARLRRQIEANGLAGKVGFCGWLGRSGDFYHGIDVMVLASRHDEGFGLVLAEAGERGLPVIATRSGGVEEIVIDGETGLLVDKGDVAAMAAAMCNLGANALLRKRLGLSARAHIVSHFSLDAQIPRFFSALAAAAREKCEAPKSRRCWGPVNRPNPLS